MGMTYKIVALKPATTIEQYLESPDMDHDADTIIDDMVFNREDGFIAWCGCPPWIKGAEGYAFRIEKRHLQNARTVLQRLLDRVEKMPFTMDKPTFVRYRENAETGEYEAIYSGSPENVAIMEAVTKVLSYDYHFGYFPWDRRVCTGGGVKSMIAALDIAIEFMEANPGRIVIGLYY